MKSKHKVKNLDQIEKSETAKMQKSLSRKIVISAFIAGVLFLPHKGFGSEEGSFYGNGPLFSLNSREITFHTFNPKTGEEITRKFPLVFFRKLSSPEELKEAAALAIQAQTQEKKATAFFKKEPSGER